MGFEGIVKESTSVSNGNRQCQSCSLLEKRTEELEENRQLMEKCDALQVNVSESNKCVLQSAFENILQQIFTNTQISALITKKKKVRS